VGLGFAREGMFVMVFFPGVFSFRTIRLSRKKKRPPVSLKESVFGLRSSLWLGEIGRLFICVSGSRLWRRSRPFYLGRGSNL